MDILVVGSGGREHAIIRALKESPRVGKIYCAPGNGGIAYDAVCLPVGATDQEGIAKAALDNKVDLVFVAPDDPLVAGMVDYLEEQGIRAFGPNKAAAAIEGSKVFSKNLMKDYGIPSAGYGVFSNQDDALAYIRDKGIYPAVIKADGLALGKGVIIAQNEEEAVAGLQSIMTDKIFGASGNEVVIEEFLTGPEVSVLAFTDGRTVRPMVSSMDHKRAFDGDKGPNTGGMGTISPNPHYTDEMAEQCMQTIFMPTIEAMNRLGRPFKGILYFGLMLTENGPKVIEYNCRFGDPEAQVVLPRLKTDLPDIIEAILDERLDSLNIAWENGACACIVIASGGYPGSYPKGLPIAGLDENGQRDDAVIYHAGTLSQDGIFTTNGGRVIGVTAKADSLEEALGKAYQAAENVTFDGSFYRKDIGRL